MPTPRKMSPHSSQALTPTTFLAKDLALQGAQLRSVLQTLPREAILSIKNFPLRSIPLPNSRWVRSLFTKRNKKMAHRVLSGGLSSFILLNLPLVWQVSGAGGTRLLINILLALLKVRLGLTFLQDHSSIRHIGLQVLIKWHNRLLLQHLWSQQPKSKLTEIPSSLLKDSTMIRRGTN